MDKKPQENKDEVFHSLNKKSVPFSSIVISIFLIALLLGIGAGYIFSQKGVGSMGSSTTGAVNSSGIQKGVIYGSSDTSTFKDTTQGVMQAGGVSGEGQYHLVRPGGISQNVYLTSSLVDLSKFIGHKVQVWGQTQTALHAGWLMDVGRVEELE
jgi:hypothetical protein